MDRPQHDSSLTIVRREFVPNFLLFSFEDVYYTIKFIESTDFSKVFPPTSVVGRFFSELNSKELWSWMVRAFPDELIRPRFCSPHKKLAGHQKLKIALQNIYAMFDRIGEAGFEIGNVKSSINWLQKVNQTGLDEITPFVTAELAIVNPFLELETSLVRPVVRFEVARPSRVSSKISQRNKLPTNLEGTSHSAGPRTTTSLASSISEMLLEPKWDFDAPMSEKLLRYFIPLPSAIMRSEDYAQLCLGNGISRFTFEVTSLSPTTINVIIFLTKESSTKTNNLVILRGLTPRDLRHNLLHIYLEHPLSNIFREGTSKSCEEFITY